MTIDEVVIEADSLTYYGNDNLAVASGNVRLVKPMATLAANRPTKEDDASAANKPVENVVILTAKNLTFQDKTGWVTATGDAKLASPTEQYSSPLIRYNLNTLMGEVGKLSGVATSSKKEYHVTGDKAEIDHNTTTISPAGLTRCPRTKHICYIFKSKRMRLVGNDVYLEKVWIKILGVPVFYLPHLHMKQNDQAPSISMTSNEGDEPDLSNPDDLGAGNSKKLKKHWILKAEANTTRASKIVVGKAYIWDRYSLHSKVELNSDQYVSLADDCGMSFGHYYLLLDGKTDLRSNPERELGLTFNRITLNTAWGLLKPGVMTRLLYTQDDRQNYQGVYSAARLDYQPFSWLSCSYFHLVDLAGSRQDWDKIEDDFMVIKNYRLGGNFMYNATIPLNPYYRIINKGSYNFKDNSWTTWSLGFDREVCCIKAGLSWDFAKEQVELRFRLNY
jgi:lipopolysaccharide assembly outer membrane protein LptD (OstA)